MDKSGDRNRHTHKNELYNLYIWETKLMKKKIVKVCPFVVLFCLLFRFISVNKYLRNPTKINTDIVLFQSHAFLLCLFSVFRSLLLSVSLDTDYLGHVYTANTVCLCVFEDVSVSRKTVFINRNCFNFSYLS